MSLKNVYKALFIDKRNYNIHEVFGVAPFMRIALDVDYKPGDVTNDNNFIEDIVFGVIQAFKDLSLEWVILENNRSDKMSWHLIFSGKLYKFIDHKIRILIYIYIYIYRSCF